MKSLARFCYDRRRMVAPGWLVLLVSLLALSNAIGGQYETEFSLAGFESQAAADLLRPEFLATAN